MSSDPVNTLPDKILESRECLLNEVRNCVRENTAALVIGAGISVPAGMPTWPGLVSRMLGYAIQYNLQDKYPGLSQADDEIRFSY